MLFTSRVSAAYGKLTHSQKVVANYVDENYEDIAFSTLEELAEKIGVSTTTVIRFARALDYSGFSEMQDSIKKEIQTKGSLPDRLERAAASSGNDLLEEAFSTDIKNIQLTLAGLHADDLEKAIEMISGANNIYVLGMRSSFSLAHYMVSRLGEIKRNVHFIQTTGLIYPEEIVNAEAGDVCIAYIFPRYSRIGINILAWMRSRGIKVVLFTSNNDLPVKAYGDVCFNCSIKSVSCKNSLTAPMCLTNYLVAELALRNYEEAHDVLSRTEEILSTGFYLGI